MNICKELITFGYAYYQVFRKLLGEQLHLCHVMMKHTRRGNNNRFFRLNHDDIKTEYKEN